MKPTVTVFGAKPASAVALDIGEASLRSSIKPTAFPGGGPLRVTQGPSALPANPSAPRAAAEPVKPTAMKPSIPAPPAPITLSALPGVQRKSLEVGIPDLVKKYPGVGLAVLQRVQRLICGIHVTSFDSVRIIGFGLDAQAELAALIKQRLDVAQAPAMRAAPQHLTRLHLLLSDVLAAFGGGFLKRSPEKVWADCRSEVEQLQKLLGDAAAELVTQLGCLSALRLPAEACSESLEALALAADYLLDEVSPDQASLLVGRVASITSSQAMVREHVIYLSQDISAIEELVLLVNDGVLLKLPSIYTQLASLAGKPTETERFLASEKLTDVLQTIKQRKNL